MQEPWLCQCSSGNMSSAACMGSAQRPEPDSSVSEPEKVTVEDSESGEEKKVSGNDTPPRVQGES